MKINSSKIATMITLMVFVFCTSFIFTRAKAIPQPKPELASLANNVDPECYIKDLDGDQVAEFCGNKDGQNCPDGIKDDKPVKRVCRKIDLKVDPKNARKGCLCRPVAQKSPAPSEPAPAPTQTPKKDK